MRASDLEHLARRLAEVPPPERELTAAEALQRLLPVLRKMRAAGHTTASIRAALADLGLRVSEKAIRKALGGSRTRRPARADDARADAPRAACTEGEAPQC